MPNPNENSDSSLMAVDHPRLVHLLQCARAKCGHVLTKDEYTWKPSCIGRTAICPMCGCSEFYSLKANGQKMTMKDHDENRDGINPELIVPTPRMGPKLKASLLDAKRRILEVNVKEHATLSAEAGVDHGGEVGITEGHVNRAADRGCCVSTCCAI